MGTQDTLAFDINSENDITTDPTIGFLPHLEAMLDPYAKPCEGGHIRFVNQGNRSAVKQAIRTNTKLFKNVLRDNVASFSFLPLAPS